MSLMISVTRSPGVSHFFSAGRSIGDSSALARAAGGRAVTLTRFGEGRLPNADTLVQAQDIVHLAVPSATVAELDEVLRRGPADV